MHYLGLDIGGTKIAAVVMDAHGWEIRRYRCPTQKSTYQQFVSCVVALIEQIRRDVSTTDADRDRLTRQYLATHWPD